MARFYGRLRGSRGEATRLGHANSGISATAESWTSIVNVRMDPNEGDIADNLTTISIDSKHGNRAVSFALDTDRIVTEAGSTDVQNALGELIDAVDTLNRVAQNKSAQRSAWKGMAEPRG